MHFNSTAIIEADSSSQGQTERVSNILNSIVKIELLKKLIGHISPEAKTSARNSPLVRQHPMRLLTLGQRLFQVLLIPEPSIPKTGLDHSRFLLSNVKIQDLSIGPVTGRKDFLRQMGEFIGPESAQANLPVTLYRRRPLHSTSNQACCRFL